MSNQALLIKAIRNGQLAEVRAALDAGALIEMETDGDGDPGLAMGIACFMGHVDIVRELFARGAVVDLPDNSLPTSPLNMALRGKRTEVVRTLIELGAHPPEGMDTGLTENELIIAHWKARRDGHAKTHDAAATLPDIEEIEMRGCKGTDTVLLESDVMRQIQSQNSR